MSTPEGAAPGSSILGAIGPEPEGATPLEEDDLVDLIPAFVATRGDLNVVEFENITEAVPWAMEQARRGGPELVLDRQFVFSLHGRMFADVWRWAGSQRRREANIGVEPVQIASQTKQTLDDAIHWHDNDVFEVDERAVRIHHRLVAVHPFTNGNGRCTRLVADLYLTAIGRPIFTWGSAGRLDGDSDARQRYLVALRAADAGDYEPLVAFARS
jgi:Fic-DOC domain mobile mystery protein B